jgi:hypothetical protein
MELSESRHSAVDKTTSIKLPVRPPKLAFAVKHVRGKATLVRLSTAHQHDAVAVHLSGSDLTVKPVSRSTDLVVCVVCCVLCAKIVFVK